MVSAWIRGIRGKPFPVYLLIGRERWDALCGWQLWASWRRTRKQHSAVGRQAWSALGSGVSGSFPVVYSLAVSGSTLYAGGSFSTAGGAAATNIARMGTVKQWSGLGSGLNGTGRALLASGGTLYVGGRFTSAGGVTANNIAQWNGNTWVNMGSGTNGAVSSLAVHGGALFVGGSFTTAGGDRRAGSGTGGDSDRRPRRFRRGRKGRSRRVSTRDRHMVRRQVEHRTDDQFQLPVGTAG